MSQYALTASRWMFLGVIAGVALPVVEARVSEAYGRVPLYFEANRGQTHGDVRFLAHGSGYSLYLTAEEAVLVLAGAGDKGKACPQKGAQLQCESRPVTLRMSLVGAASHPLVSGLEEQPGKANYFIGRDASQWRTNVSTYAKVQYHEVYRGSDLIYYGNQRELEYDFVIAPGADPQQIGLDFRGAERLEIDGQGALVLHTGAGPVRVRRPAVYQEVEGIRREIAGGYARKGANRVGFELAAYDTSSIRSCLTRLISAAVRGTLTSELSLIQLVSLSTPLATPTRSVGPSPPIFRPLRALSSRRAPPAPPLPT